jgi:cystathionine gamma-synthase
MEACNIAPMRFETLAAHAGRHPDPANGAVVPSIVLSTTFERQPDGSLPGGHLYSRMGNPNRNAFEEALAALEGGAAGVAFSSGQAASMSVFHALGPGDHAVLPLEMYYNTRGLLDAQYGRWHLQASYVDTTDVENVQRAMQPNTKLVWIETPSNPRLQISDIARIAAIAHAAGAWCVTDNTWATPLFQRPLELGADAVTHSTTKYMGGHSDVLGGCVVVKATENELYRRLRSYQAQGGAVPSAFDCWLLLRSLPTLPCRVRTQCASAKRLAAFLAGHPRVQTVHYPGLASHPQHALANQQMSDFGGMLSFEVKGGAAAAIAVAAQVKLFLRATSLGGYESLIEHRASVEGPKSPTPPGLLRCSIGLEHADDLMEDLAQALES